MADNSNLRNTARHAEVVRLFESALCKLEQSGFYGRLEFTVVVQDGIIQPDVEERAIRTHRIDKSR